jgi:hypothetical protein
MGRVSVVVHPQSVITRWWNLDGSMLTQLSTPDMCPHQYALTISRTGDEFRKTNLASWAPLPSKNRPRAVSQFHSHGPLARLGTLPAVLNAQRNGGEAHGRTYHFPEMSSVVQRTADQRVIAHPALQQILRRTWQDKLLQASPRPTHPISRPLSQAVR